MLTCDEFNELLEKRSTFIIDGALATELEARGHDLNNPLWSGKTLQEDPESIKQVHLDYYLAGADIAITASYQASLQGFHDHLGIDDEESLDLIQQSVKLAQQAREEACHRGVNGERKLLVAGSVGPYGAFLADGSEYRGGYVRTQEDFKAFHSPRIRALVDAKVDLLALETMPKLTEIIALLELLREEYSTSIAWLSCTLRDAGHLSDGTPLRELLECLQVYRDLVVAVGVNCIPAEIALESLQNMRKLTAIPLLCYPNSGEQWNAETKTWSGAGNSGTSTRDDVRSWQAAGARLIGGCCRTGPNYIEAVSEKIKKPSNSTV